MLQKGGQVGWLKMPETSDGCVELQLRTFLPGKRIAQEPTIYRLPKSHGAFNENMGLLIAAALPGHLVTLHFTEQGQIVSVAIGEKA